LGKKYYDICNELSISPQDISNNINKEIIKKLFRSDYCTLITDIITNEVDGKALIKIKVKDNFFLYHPSYEFRFDVHEYLISQIIRMNLRNCALLRDILTGFFERIFYPNKHNFKSSPDRESINFIAFEFDYINDDKSIFDFEKQNWNNVSLKSKINYFELREKTKINPEIRKDCCKAVNLMKSYVIFIARQTREIVAWEKVDLSDKNIIAVDYL